MKRVINWKGENITHRVASSGVSKPICTRFYCHLPEPVKIDISICGYFGSAGQNDGGFIKAADSANSISNDGFLNQPRV